MCAAVGLGWRDVRLNKMWGDWMAPASMPQFNCVGIELGGVRSACLKSDYKCTHQHPYTHTHIMPAGPLSPSCTDKGICWGHKRCLIRLYPLTLPLCLTQRPPTLSIAWFPYVSVTQPDVVPDLLTLAGWLTPSCRQESVLTHRCSERRCSF